jgi:tetratricopeptide (TPR) repeat protein
MYPDKGGLIFLHGQVLARAGQKKSAARMMVEAISRPDAISNLTELIQAVEVVVDGFGPVKAELAVLHQPVPDSVWSLEARERSLGLVLASHVEKPGARDRARYLLAAVIESHPDDALATLRLGDVVNQAEHQETLYRRALLLDAHWPEARARLAIYLLHAGRAEEALEFTDGHETESPELFITHGRALLLAGRFEEAAIIFDQAVDIEELLSSELYRLKWLAEMNIGRHAQALATAEIALKLYAEEADWYERRVAALRNLELLDESDY